jgi:serine protease
MEDGMGFLKRWLALGCASFLLLASACYDPPRPPEEEETFNGTIRGFLTPLDAQAQSHFRPVAFAPLADKTPIRPVARKPTSGSDTAADLEKQMDWMPGELVAFFETDTFDKASLKMAVKEMVQKAGLDHVAQVETALCAARRFCQVTLKDADGEKLNRVQTRDAAFALHKVRPEKMRAVVRNFIMQAFASPNDEFYPFQWHHEFARLPAAWDINTGDPQTVIAVIDSGLVLTHPDLVNRTVQGADMVSNEGVAGDGNARDTDPTDPGDNMFGEGNHSWHGTHVGGIIAAEANNSTGVAGVNWNAKLQAVRVLGIGGGSQLDILSGIYWALGDQTIDGVPPNDTPAKVLNLSLGGVVDTQTQGVWTQEMDYILNQEAQLYGNPIIIVAAGNEDQDVENVTPANIYDLITVGGARYDGLRASYSNWGATVDVMAPGGQIDIDQNGDGYPDGILSTFGNEYNFEQGTSMACPVVAGIISLAVAAKKAQGQELLHAEAQSLLTTTAEPSGQCSEGCGTGHVNASSVMLSVSGGEVPSPTPVLAVDTYTLAFVEGQNQAGLNVYNIGGGTLQWTATLSGAQASLFGVTPASGSVGSAQFEPLTVTLNRGTFEAGSANLEIVGGGEALGQVINVNLSFAKSEGGPAFQLQAAVVEAFQKDEAGNFSAVGQTVTTYRANGFTWEITGLPPGQYYVYALGDDNNDNIFDWDTESKGAYPTIGAPEAITLAKNETVEGIEIPLKGGFVGSSPGQTGMPCLNDADCTFAPDAECITAAGGWPGGYCSRDCGADGYCGPGGSCEILDCDTGPCAICLRSCVSASQCRAGEGYLCDAYGTCTPQGF